MEIWKDIKDYEGLYQVSSLGNVKSIDRAISSKNGKRIFNVNGKPLKGFANKNGYKRVHLTKEHKGKSYFVHRLVAFNFLDKPNYKCEVNHIDGNKFNNFISNLEWVTHSENLQHAFDNGLAKKMMGSKNHKAKLNEDDVREIRKIASQKRNYGRKDIAKKYGVTEKHIQDIVNSKTLWNHV
jgi:hypothetical protein